MQKPHDHPAQMHEVVVIGAGFAGIGSAIQLQQIGADYVVLEKAAEIAGVCGGSILANSS
jgi:cation diffusion facilitator CzcD-associated flavoprotein CzcO